MGRSVLRRDSFRVVDDQNLDRFSPGLQPETELLLKRGKEIWWRIRIALSRLRGKRRKTQKVVVPRIQPGSIYHWSHGRAD